MKDDLLFISKQAKEINEASDIITNYIGTLESSLNDSEIKIQAWIKCDEDTELGFTSGDSHWYIVYRKINDDMSTKRLLKADRTTRALLVEYLPLLVEEVKRKTRVLAGNVRLGALHAKKLMEEL